MYVCMHEWMNDCTCMYEIRFEYAAPVVVVTSREDIQFFSTNGFVSTTEAELFQLRTP